MDGWMERDGMDSTSSLCCCSAGPKERDQSHSEHTHRHTDTHSTDTHSTNTPTHRHTQQVFAKTSRHVSQSCTHILFGDCIHDDDCDLRLWRHDWSNAFL